MTWPSERVAAPPQKPCSRCGEVKPIGEFFRNRSCRDGYHGRCKVCKAEEDRLSYHRSADRRQKIIFRRPKDAKAAAANRAWSARNKEKIQAHKVVERAIRWGKLKRPELCGGCGSAGLLHAHHEDYNKPLGVRWLCPQCHADEHRRERVGKAA